MNDIVHLTTHDTLPVLLSRAEQALRSVEPEAQFLEARETASLIYHTVKRSHRLMKAKEAHTALISAAHRVQGDALVIEARANYRLADEIDAAQERGEIQTPGGARNFIIPDENNEDSPAKLYEAGLSAKEIHEARQIRDAERENPGIVKRVVEEALERGEEPTKTLVRKAVSKTPRSPTSEKGRHLDALMRNWNGAPSDVKMLFLQKISKEVRAKFGAVFGLSDG